MGRKSNKIAAFNSYLNKWGMTEYKFFGDSWDHSLYIVSKDEIEVIPYLKRKNEIKTITTLLKRLQLEDNSFLAVMCERSGQHKFYSLKELKEYMLIRKIAGI